MILLSVLSHWKFEAYTVITLWYAKYQTIRQYIIINLFSKWYIQSWWMIASEWEICKCVKLFGICSVIQLNVLIVFSLYMMHTYSFQQAIYQCYNWQFATWCCYAIGLLCNLLALCEQNPLVTIGFLLKGPVMWNFDVLFNPWRTELSRFNKDKIMAADALAPYVARTSTAMILTI